MSQDLLIDCALLGTDRSSAVPTIEDGPVGALLAGIATSEQSNAQKLLRTAAVLSVCQRTGYEPMLVEAPPAGPAAKERENAARSSMLEPVLALASRRPVHEALTMMADAGLRIPAPLLRQVLDMGSKSVELREPIVRVLGERGRWLASQDASWAYARSAAENVDDDQKWSHGSLKQRVDVLKRQRSTDPEAARRRVVEEVTQLSPGERAQLFAAMRVNLSAADEPDLNKLLADRAREPRRVIAGLLATIPQSAYAQRMQARLAPLVRKKGGVLGVGGSWQVDPPEKIDDSWKADGLVSDKPVNSPLGERAWWLQQLIAASHPAWWCEHTGLLPDELVRWAIKSQWADSIISGWLQALEVIDAADWPQALLEHARKKDLLSAEDMLMGQVQESERDAAWMRQLKSDGASTVASEILAKCPLGKSITAKLSNALVAALLEEVNKGTRNSWRTYSVLPEIACLVHFSSLPALQQWKVREEAETYVQEAFNQVQAYIKARQALQKLIVSPSTTLAS